MNDTGSLVPQLFARSLSDADRSVGERSRASSPLGIVPWQTLRQMAKQNVVMATGGISEEQYQPASLDLRLSHTAYRVRSSFLPGRGTTVMQRVRDLDGYQIDLSHGAVLETNAVYVVQLLESLRLPSKIAGFANPKSTTGRLDVLTRLITDYSNSFDQIAIGYSGHLYVEIAPRTFSVVVRLGTRLNQLRLQRGSATLAMSELERRHDLGELVMVDGAPPNPKHDSVPKLQNGLVPVTIDLKGSGPGSVIGYRAKKHTDRIDLALGAHYDAEDFWEPLKHGREASLVLNPDDFYILVTREEVRVPPEYAAEMVPYDTKSGEYRVHYAGFFDPGFGWDLSLGGSRAVLEVRSHEVPFMLEHGQTVGWLRYERMADRPTKVYGPVIGSTYQNQGLALAKQFKPFAPQNVT